MALTDDMNATMLVSPTNGGGGFGGFDNGSGWWILLLFLLVGGNGWGNGFGGGFGGDGIYPWMNQSNQINSGITDIATQLCNGFAGVNAAVANGFAQSEIADNARQIANMQTAFNSQVAVTQGLNDVAMNLQNCCCENRSNIADLKYTVATENCADRAAISDGIRDILSATQAQTQAILNQLCNDKIEQKNDTIAQLRSELLYARGQASQDVQTAAIQAGQRNLANEVEQYVAPRAIPAYVVQNPNCCTQNYGCGCGM